MPQNHQPRIIAGLAKGKTLSVPTVARPTPAIVRKSLFDILRNIYPQSVCFLDLYAGAGTVGLEAASQGFIVTMVEKNKKAAELISKNRQNLGLKAEIIIDDALKFWEKSDQSFEIVFIDPPYQQDIPQIADQILENMKTIPNQTIIFQTPAKIQLPNHVFFKEKRIYGSNALWIYQKVTRIQD